MRYWFADCQLNTEHYTLYRADRAIQLRPQEYRVLTYLLAHRQRVVSKQELAETCWLYQAVSDNAVESCIKRVRRTIGDGGRAQRMIETRYGCGYQFIAPVVPSHPRADHRLSQAWTRVLNG